MVCNTALDKISKINLAAEYLTLDFPLELGGRPVGPHNLCIYNDNIITANNYNNSISIINLAKEKEMSTIYVGAHPNDVEVIKDKAYVICGESNSLGIIDLVNQRVIINLKTGKYPHSIAILKEKKLGFICNMDDNSVFIIDCIENEVISKINVGKYPTKLLISSDKKNIFVCESNLGEDRSGFVSIISIESKNIIAKIKVGRTPIDMWEDQGLLYVSNFLEGSISVIDLNKAKEIMKIPVLGMPKGIVKYKSKIYFADYGCGNIYELNLEDNSIKNIASGTEPNAMLLI